MDEFPEIGSNWCPLCLKFTQSTKFEDTTYPSDDYALARFRVRVRKCQNCEISYETYEMEKDDFSVFVIAKEKLARIRTLANAGQLDLTLLNKILYADKLIEIDDPEIWEKVPKSESEIEDEIFDDQASKEIFSNWDPDLSWTTSDKSENQTSNGNSKENSEVDNPPF